MGDFGEMGFLNYDLYNNYGAQQQRHDFIFIYYMG